MSSDSNKLQFMYILWFTMIFGQVRYYKALHTLLSYYIKQSNREKKKCTSKAQYLTKSVQDPESYFLCTDNPLQVAAYIALGQFP
uniref:Uncharacterized protein n=1 Tax=Pyxicephalus adspersus TaxID=30357 RepID=A0AAV3A829_PYXAD|nr:TPA: hypothetical protein GDO54_016386 [Pyxicephalus adspersus]